MDPQDVMKYARGLYEAHGDKAEAEAAQRARQHEEAGEAEEAEKWRSIQKAISEMRGPHES